MDTRRGGSMMRFVPRFGYVGLVIMISAVAFTGCAEKDTTYFEVDTTPPLLTGASETEGGIAWTTDEACNCVLLYGSRKGTYNHYAYSVNDGGRDHYVGILDVEPGRYYVRVVATDRAGNSSTSEEMIFDINEVPETECLVYTMVDVGWGDCHFLEFPNGTTVMVDAGFGKIGEYPHDLDVFSFLDARGLTGKSDIDYMILTHAHADHYGGFIDLLGFYRPSAFMGPAEAYSDVWDISFGTSGTLEERLDDIGVPKDSLRTGQTSSNCDFLDWDPEHGIEVEVLSSGAGLLVPPDVADDEGDEGSLTNNDSVVLMITLEDVDILLAADAEEFAEQLMVKSYERRLDCDVLKVGHHGSYSSSSDKFLEFTTPRVGLIPNSMAENPGVFSQTVLNSLLGRGIDYYASDHAYRNPGRYDDPLDGNLSVTTDGTTFTVWSWKQ
jgi:beta-lactamase superfamily II metal-dependent hydrolase